MAISSVIIAEEKLDSFFYIYIIVLRELKEKLVSLSLPIHYFLFQVIVDL